MQHRNPLSFISLAVALIISTGMFAQEKTEVTILVKKDGKVVQDTTYQFEDPAEAKHAVKMMEILSSDSDNEEHTHAMVFVSEDMDEEEKIEFLEDSHVWISEDEHDGETIKIIIDKDKDGSWHVDSKELKDVDEDVRVIVVKKDKHCDHDHDENEEIDIEVKVEKKVKRKK